MIVSDPRVYNQLSAKFEQNRNAKLGIWSKIVALQKAGRWNNLTEEVAKLYTNGVTQVSFDKAIDDIREKFIGAYKNSLNQGYREDNGLPVKQLTEDQKKELEEFFNYRLEVKLEIIKNDLTPQKAQSALDACREKTVSAEEEIRGLDEQLTVIKNQKKQLKQERTQLFLTKNVWTACWTGNLAQVKQELGKLWGWPISSRKEFINTQFDDAGLPLLHIAAKEGQLEIIRFLLEEGASADLKDKMGYTPLHRAAQAGKLEVVTELFKHNVNVNAKAMITSDEDKDDSGYLRRPLHMAAYNGHPRVLQLLLERGADANAQTNGHAHRVTPLHEAVMKAQLMCVIYLVQNPQLDVNLRDKLNYAPLRHAVEQSSLEMVKLIAKHSSWKCPADPQDPNHPQQLLAVKKFKDQAQIDDILRKLLPKP